MLKLGPHLLPGGEADTLAWLRLKPAVAKFCYTFDLAASAAPETLCLGRPDESFIGQHPLGSGDPGALARQMAAEVYAPLVHAYPDIDVWEGPNEIGCNPDQVAEMRWYAAFLAELGRQIHALGRRAGLAGLGHAPRHGADAQRARVPLAGQRHPRRHGDAGEGRLRPELQRRRELAPHRRGREPVGVGPLFTGATIGT